MPVPLPLVSGLSSVRINIPPDLRPTEARQNILFAVQELGKRYPQGLPKLHPVKVLLPFSVNLLFNLSFCTLKRHFYDNVPEILQTGTCIWISCM